MFRPRIACTKFMDDWCNFSFARGIRSAEYAIRKTVHGSRLPTSRRARRLRRPRITPEIYTPCGPLGSIPRVPLGYFRASQATHPPTRALGGVGAPGVPSLLRGSSREPPAPIFPEQDKRGDKWQHADKRAEGNQVIGWFSAAGGVADAVPNIQAQC